MFLMRRRKWLIITLLISLGFMAFTMRKREHSSDKVASSIEEDFYAKHPDQRPFWTGLPLPRTQWDKSSPIMFLHIGKSGGTSFDGAMKQWIGQNRLPHNMYIGMKHFDWTVIKQRKSAVTAVTLLRNPVERAISHFHFMKTKSNTAFREANMEHFLRDKELMMAFRGCWQDGQGAVSWIAGLHIAEWVAHVPQKNRDKMALEEIMLNTEYTLNLAAERLETIAWFGLLERRDESLNTFNLQFEMQHKLAMPQHLNAGAGKSPVGEEEHSKLTWLMPYDMWLYNYAVLLFNARLAHLTTGEPYHPPARPALPQVTCLSTRYLLTCDSGPFGPAFYHQEHSTPTEHLDKFGYLARVFVK